MSKIKKKFILFLNKSSLVHLYSSPPPPPAPLVSIPTFSFLISSPLLQTTTVFVTSEFLTLLILLNDPTYTPHLFHLSFFFYHLPQMRKSRWLWHDKHFSSSRSVLVGYLYRYLGFEKSNSVRRHRRLIYISQWVKPDVGKNRAKKENLRLHITNRFYELMDF